MLFPALLLTLAQAAPAGAAQPPAPATPKPEPTGPVVELVTSLGSIKIALDAEKAPITVDNFLKYVRGGFYDGTVFHRVMTNFMIQGGGMTPDLKEKTARPPIKNEARNGLRNSRGTIAMARTNDPNSATSQFFINVKDNTFLNKEAAQDKVGYAVFGKVVEGMDVVKKIEQVKTTTKGPHQNVPVDAVLIKSAKVVSE